MNVEGAPGDQPVRIELVDAASTAAARNVVQAGLYEFNALYVSEPDTVSSVFTARDTAGTIIGGLVSQLFWASENRGWLYIHMVWVATAWRRRGIGRQLLRAMEAEAVRRGCRRAFLDTYEFQAREFYEREGYVVFGVLEDFPPGYRRYSMQKDLVVHQP